MLKNFTKFALKGVAGIVVNTTILWILTRYLFESYFTTYILAPSISSEVSILFTYIICYFWIWNNRVHNNKRDFFRRIPGYNATACISFGIKMALIITIERIFHFDVVICNLLAMTISGLINFLAGEKIIFREIKPQYGN